MAVWDFCLNVYEHILMLASTLISIFDSSLADLLKNLGDTQTWFGTIITYLAELVNGTSVGSLTILELMFSSGMVIIIVMGLYKFFFR